MNHLYMERHDDKDNMHRFYQMFVTPGLFDDWSLVRKWGRVGSPGTVPKDWFDTEEKAVSARQSICEAKVVNGGLNAQKPEADIWRIMPPYFDQEKGGDLAPF
jgi:predicted DNA-binding WGR domain protein